MFWDPTFSLDPTDLQPADSLKRIVVLTAPMLWGGVEEGGVDLTSVAARKILRKAEKSRNPKTPKPSK